MPEPFRDYDDPNAVVAYLKDQGIEAKPVYMGYDDALKAIRGVTAEQVSKLRASKPEASPEELRAIVIKGMRTALAMPSDQMDGWLAGVVKEEDGHSQETLTTFLLLCMVSMFRSSFGLDTSNAVTQENLMVEVQKALDEVLPSA